LLDSARRRDLFLNILEQVRQRYGFVVVGYVVMPEHFHLLNRRTGEGESLDRDASAQAAFRAPSSAWTATTPP
jgi:hypothetical protein